MKYTLTVIAIICFRLGPSQSFFDITPNVNGVDSQGVCRFAILDSNSFFVIGHRYDTAGPGSNTKPWWGEFDYNGSIKSISSLHDSLYNESFYPEKILYDKIDSTRYCLYGHRPSGGNNYYPYLMEVDLKKKSVIRSLLVINSSYPGAINGLGAIRYINDKIHLVSYVYKNDSTIVFLTIIDSAFNKIDEIEIPSVVKNLYPNYLEVSSDSLITIFGDALISGGITDSITNVLLTYNIESQKVNFKKPPSDNRYAFLLSHANSIIRRKNGSWVISATKFIDKNSVCSDCFLAVPYVYSVDSSFNTLLWETQFYDIPEVIGDYYEIYSMTSNSNKYFVAGNYRNGDVDYFPNSGIIFSATNNGDSLWMRHYVPLSWENDRVAWAKLRSIKYSPYHSLIAVGEIADKDLQIVRPWILQVDTFGCIIPGCEIVNQTDNYLNEQLNEGVFKIFPNPVFDELYLLGLKTFPSEIKVKLVSLTGVTLKQISIRPNSGFQYILPVDDLPPGLYSFIVSDGYGNIIQSNLITHFNN